MTTATAIAPRFIVIRVKDCPIRGEVHVIESVALSLVDARIEADALSLARPADLFVCEQISADDPDFA